MRAQVVFFQVESYPASPAMVMCNSDEQLNGKLQALNEQFEEYAVLSDILRAVCAALSLGEQMCDRLKSVQNLELMHELHPLSMSTPSFWELPSHARSKCLQQELAVVQHGHALRECIFCRVRQADPGAAGCQHGRG